MEPNTQAAFEKIIHYASALDTNVKDDPMFDGMSEHLGKVNKLYKTCNNHIRRRVEFDSKIRRLLVIDPLPPEARPIYDMDRPLVGKGKILVPTTTQHFHIESKNKDGYSIATRLSRLTQKAYHAIMQREDAIMAELLEACVRNPATESNKPVNLSEFITCPFPVAVKQMSESYWKSRPNEDPQDGAGLCKIVVNYRDYVEIFLKMADQIKEHPELLADNYNWYDASSGRVYGWDVITNTHVPRGRIYGLPEPEYLGVIPIEHDIRVVEIGEQYDYLDCYQSVGYGIIVPENVFAVNFEVKEEK